MYSFLINELKYLTKNELELIFFKSEVIRETLITISFFNQKFEGRHEEERFTKEDFELVIFL